MATEVAGDSSRTDEEPGSSPGPRDAAAGPPVDRRRSRATADPAPRQGAGEAGAERAMSLLVAGFVALAASGPISDNSLLTHIATGRLQVDGGLPEQNPFLTTSSDFPVPSWWWSAALGRAEQALGLTGVRLLTVLVAAALGWLVVRACRPADQPDRPASGGLVQVLPAVVVVALLVPFLTGRPHLAGYALLAAALVVWRERRSPWWLVALFAVWVNVHGTWLYGLGVLALALAAEVIDDRSLHLDRLRWLAAAAGGLLLGGIWYPERFRLVLLPTEQLGSPEARAAVKLYKEWQPVPTSSSVLWVLAVVVLLAAYGALKSRRAGTGLMVLALAVLGVGAMRLAPVAAISLGAVAAMGVAAASRMGPPRAAVRVALGAVGAVFLALAVLNALTGPHEDLSRYPVQEVTWMQQRDLVANEEVAVIHNDWVGNYLEYRYGADASAWMDDRPSVETLMDYSALRRLDPGWEEALGRADPDVVLWQREDPLPEELAGQPEWNVALTTDDFLLLCHARIADRCR
jgi:hypothetical protein